MVHVDKRFADLVNAIMGECVPQEMLEDLMRDFLSEEEKPKLEVPVGMECEDYILVHDCYCHLDNGKWSYSVIYV
jgi:hypothetical protein